MYVYMYIYIYMQMCGQFSRAQSGKMGPAPGRFELSKGMFTSR